MSIENLPNRNYDLLGEIQRVKLDLEAFINDHDIDINWLKEVDHIGIEASGLEDFEEKFKLLSHDAVNAYKGLVYHQHLAAIEYSKGFQVHPNVKNAKWIELIGPRLREIPTSYYFTGLPSFPKSDNIHFGFFNEYDDRAYGYFKSKGAEPETSSTPRHSGFAMKLNEIGDSIQIMDRPLSIIIKEYTTGFYPDVNLSQFKV